MSPIIRTFQITMRSMPTYSISPSPVATVTSNTTELGRGQNRRVELVRQ